MGPRTGSFEYEGFRLVYDEYGRGGRPVLLTPGLLLSRKLHAPLASTLARQGYRVLCLDPLGHGDSDRPLETWNYSMTIFGAQVLALMDHLELERAVLGGTSLGANVTLEAAAREPERVQGMLIEMPVLDRALLACAIAYTPLTISLTLGAPLMRAAARLARLVPRRGPLLAQLLLDLVRQDPGPSGAVLQGLFFGRTAPPREERRTLEPPALVIGHPRDPIHPFTDSDMLVRELPNARLLEASSILELRLRPERLTAAIVRFIDACWEHDRIEPGRGQAPGREVGTGAAPGAGAARRHSA